MGPKEKKKSNSTISQPQKVIYIVGPVMCYNSLLSSFLESEVGAKCQVFESLDKIPKRSPEDTGQINLVLWDCFGKSVENCYIDYQANENRIIQHDFLALSNISPGLGFEERIMSCGAHGFFYTHDSLEQMVKGVRAIFNGELWISRTIMADHIKKMSNPHHKSNKNDADLTLREIGVLTMVAAGSKNTVIADKLCISPHTVKTHLYNIFKKIDLPNRLQASLWAAKNLGEQ